MSSYIVTDPFPGADAPLCPAATSMRACVGFYHARRALQNHSLWCPGLTRDGWTAPEPSGTAEESERRCGIAQTPM